MYPDGSKTSLSTEHRLTWPRSFLRKPQQKLTTLIFQNRMRMLVTHAGLWQDPARVQKGVLASSCNLTDAWEEFRRAFCLSWYKRFQIFNCRWRVGGKHWLFYNLICSSVWMLFAAERGGKKKSDLSGKWGRKHLSPVRTPPKVSIFLPFHTTAPGNRDHTQSERS